MIMEITSGFKTKAEVGQMLIWILIILTTRENNILEEDVQINLDKL